MPSQYKEVLCTYHYDPLDCLIGLNPAKQGTLQRFYCKSRLVTEIQGLARCSIVQQGDQLLAQQKRLGDTLETDLWATDQQRSVMHTVGERPLPIVYSPYGHRHAESGLTSLLGFNGERPDTATGHYLLGNGYRAFNPILMRFNSPDNLSPFGKGGLNSYTYCLGDPVNRGDETGRFSAPWIAKASTDYIKSRHAIIANTPWYEWSSRDIELVKHSTRQSPFSLSTLQEKRLFGLQISSKSLLPVPVAKRRIGFFKPDTLQVISAQAVDPRNVVPVPRRIGEIINENSHNTLMERFYKSQLPRRSSIDLGAFIITPRASYIENQSGKFKYVMIDLKESFDLVGSVRRVTSPSAIKLASKIRNE